MAALNFNKYPAFLNDFDLICVSNTDFAWTRIA